MAYTLQEWTDFVENKMDKLTVIGLPVMETAFFNTQGNIIAIPGSKSHCTIANATSHYTGMDPIKHKIEVDADYIRFVLNGKRYFLYHEVVGAKHIKSLDTLAFCENNGAEALKKFEPFTLKLRFAREKTIHSRPPVSTVKTSDHNTPQKTKTTEIVTTTTPEPPQTISEPEKVIIFSEATAPLISAVTPTGPLPTIERPKHHLRRANATTSRWLRKRS